MRKILVTCVMMMVAAPAVGGDEAVAKPPAMPPEVKKTVDAFIGKWVFDATLSMEGKQIKTKLSWDCKKTAGGNAASCTMKGKVPGFPDADDSYLIGYDAGGKM